MYKPPKGYIVGTLTLPPPNPSREQRARSYLDNSIETDVEAVGSAPGGGSGGGSGSLVRSLLGVPSHCVSEEHGLQFPCSFTPSCWISGGVPQTGCDSLIYACCVSPAAAAAISRKVRQDLSLSLAKRRNLIWIAYNSRMRSRGRPVQPRTEMQINEWVIQGMLGKWPKEGTSLEFLHGILASRGDNDVQEAWHSVRPSPARSDRRTNAFLEISPPRLGFLDNPAH